MAIKIQQSGNDPKNNRCRAWDCYICVQYPQGRYRFKYKFVVLTLGSRGCFDSNASETNIAVFLRCQADAWSFRVHKVRIRERLQFKTDSKCACKQSILKMPSCIFWRETKELSSHHWRHPLQWADTGNTKICSHCKQQVFQGLYQALITLFHHFRPSSSIAFSKAACIVGVDVTMPRSRSSHRPLLKSRSFPET